LNNQPRQEKNELPSDLSRIKDGIDLGKYVYYEKEKINYYYMINPLLDEYFDVITDYSQVILVSNKFIAEKTPKRHHVSYRSADFGAASYLILTDKSELEDYIKFINLVIEGGNIETSEKSLFLNCLLRNVELSKLYCEEAFFNKGNYGLSPYGEFDHNYYKSVACYFDDCEVERCYALRAIIDSSTLYPYFGVEGSYLKKFKGVTPKHFLKEKIPNYPIEVS